MGFFSQNVKSLLLTMCNVFTTNFLEKHLGSDIFFLDLHKKVINCCVKWVFIFLKRTGKTQRTLNIKLVWSCVKNS